MQSSEIHRQLLDPAAYPETTHRVEYCETHISRVYLTDHHAYKFKKPLDLGFLDYSTLELRRHFCSEEVRLNRRFAPDTYLGVAVLRDSGGHLHVDGNGRVVDYAVRMLRLPGERMLDRLIDKAASELPGEITRLAVHLSPLLDSLPVCQDESEGGHGEAVAQICEENLMQTQALIGPTLSAEAHRTMTAITRRQIAQLKPVFASREQRGYVRDGHGDLHARNICMTNPIRIYDCIEFSRRLRVDDIAAELAFLLMDLEFRGRRDLAARFLTSYPGHADDHELAILLPFYKCYRAWVRGKVEALLARDRDTMPEIRQSAAEQSRRYFNLALGYHVPPTLLLTMGLMGVGKSTLARALAEALGAEWLRSDVIRKELPAPDRTQSGADAFEEGLYSREMTTLTYGVLRHRAERLLLSGRTVIVDASFSRQAERLAFLELADRLSIPGWILHVRCDPATTLSRLDRREAEGHDPSDGRRELYKTQEAGFDPPTDGLPLITIDSSTGVDYNIQAIICRLING